jgi:hypothetical protein
MKTDRRRPIHILAWSLLAVWLSASLAGLWWFGRAQLQPFTVDTAQFRHLLDGARVPDRIAHALGLDATAGRVTLLHFGDADCRCDRTGRRHLQRLRQRFTATGMHFVEVAPDRAALFAGWLPVQSVPAAVVLDRNQRVAYFGPYGSGATCLKGDAVQVERALTRALDGSAGSPRLDLLGVGCYCPGPAASLANASEDGTQRTST